MNHNTPSSSAASKVGTAFSNIRPAPTLAGKWLKDYNSSDMEAMRKALDAMRISGIQKQAAMKMINGMDIAVAEDEASVRYLTKPKIPFYKVEERYKLGKETKMQRRDQRRGQQRAVARSLDSTNIVYDIEWDGELPGKVTETMSINEHGNLVVRGSMMINGETYNILQVYNRETPE